MLNQSVAKSPCFSFFAEKIRWATYPPPPGSAPGYQVDHQITPRYTNNVIAGIQTESYSGKKASREPDPLATSIAPICDFKLSIPPTAFTARIARTITIAILSAN